jgi:hypothetical protein
MQLAIRGQLTEVNPLEEHLAIGKHHAPRKANLLVMRIDTARKFDARSRELLEHSADVIDKLLSACDMCGWVGVSAVRGPRAFQQLLSERTVGFAPSLM